MKKITIYILCALALANGLVSCSKMLETDSTRQVFDPELNSKSDSVFYAFGIMQAIQELADQYYYQNEMRGELVTTTDKTDDNLRTLANYSADTSNKYDSIYRYYKVINNCNYYLAHRDTALYSGNENVAINEYAAVLAFRAWAYLQAARVYGKIPYITEPLTTISQINGSNYAEKSLVEIAAAESAQLEAIKGRYGSLNVPTFRADAVAAGTTNFGTTKQFNPATCFVVMNVILGELYLEMGEYEKAAKCYFDHLNENAGYVRTAYIDRVDESKYPEDYESMTLVGSQNSAYFGGVAVWGRNIFTNSALPSDVITYIPMAVNYTRGTVTSIPEAYGYAYYSTGTESDLIRVQRPNSCPEQKNIQIVPSKEYMTMADTANFYYYRNTTGGIIKGKNSVTYKNIGDARANLVYSDPDSLYTWVTKPSNGNVYLYRQATVWLHLAEALNRMGYPDLAFAILKDGLQANLQTLVVGSSIQPNAYISQKSIDLLKTRIPFFADAYIEKFTNESNDVNANARKNIIGIHAHGCGVTAGSETPYQYEKIVQAKMDYLNKKFGLGVSTMSDADRMNAVEDLLCDEYAMEFAFEGTRFSDLQRMARHKNESGIYGGNFGSRWFASKLAGNNPQVNLMVPDNWYLPYK